METFPTLKLHSWEIFTFCRWVLGSEKHMKPWCGCIVSATAEKPNGRFQTPNHIGLKNSFSKYGQAIYHWKALEELNNFYKKTIG